MLYFIRYGCYLQKECEVVDCDSLKEAEDMAYESAYEVTSACYGCHGFGLSEEEEEEYSEDELEEIEHEYIEGAIDVLVEEYNPEIHDENF